MINAVNEQFSRFVNFAQERVDAGKEKAIASKGDIMAHGGTMLEERKIKVTDKIDWGVLEHLPRRRSQARQQRGAGDVQEGGRRHVRR